MFPEVAENVFFPYQRLLYFCTFNSSTAIARQNSHTLFFLFFFFSSKRQEVEFAGIVHTEPMTKILWPRRMRGILHRKLKTKFLGFFLFLFLPTKLSHLLISSCTLNFYLSVIWVKTMDCPSAQETDIEGVRWATAWTPSL